MSSIESEKQIKVNDLVSIKFLYSSEPVQVGIVTSITKDLNFYYVFEVITDRGMIFAPLGVVEIRKLENEHKVHNL